MNKKAIHALEYMKIIDQLTQKASSPLGKEKCRRLRPSNSLSEIETMQLQTAHALTRLFQKGNINFGSVKDIRASLKRL